MKRLHRYIIKTFIGPFVLVFAVVVFILLMQFLWKYIDDLVGKALDMVVIAKLLFYAAAGLIPMALPLAVLLASIMTLGSLGENYELIAMKASGISLQRIMKPLMAVSLVIGVLAFLCANYLTPYTNLKLRSMIYSIQQKRPELQIHEGVFFDGIDNYSLRIGRRDYGTGMLYDLQIYDHTSGAGNVALTLADSGRMDMTEDKRFMEIVLYQAESYNDVLDSRNRLQTTRPFRRDFYETQTIRIPLGDFSLQETDENLFKQGYQMMNIKQLTFVIDSLRTQLSTHYDDLLLQVKPRFYTRSSGRVYRDTIVPDIAGYFPQLPKEARRRAMRNVIEQARYVRNDAATAQIITAAELRDSRRYAIEFQRKFSMAFACFIFFFIGAPLGSVIRKGGMGVSIVVAVLFFVVYYVINIVGEKSAREGLLTPVEGMWIASAVLLPVGLLLTYQATRDASILTADLYRNFLKKILGYVFPERKTALPAVTLPVAVTPETTARHIEDFNRDALSYIAKMPAWPPYRDMWQTGRTLSSADARQRDSLAQRYAVLRAMLDRLKLDMSAMKYTAYPDISFTPPRLQKRFWGEPLLLALLFPLGGYFYLRMYVAQGRFKSQLTEITRVNRIVKQAVEELEP